MAASGGGGSSKSTVVDQISQSVQSTSNLLNLMLESSPSHTLLSKLPKNLLSRISTIKNTELVLEQMPQVISALDAHVESGLQSLPHLDTVVKLLSNMQSSQLKSLSRTQLTQQESEPPEQDSQVG
ncbi:tobamovirus multiplication protein 2B [Primulina eburnea]|uniref:tobamovirus multiplication protein 2B n=1 Tax=Primulina eburnea TaxID=1245227 RepID=UPI003C6C2ED7